MTEGEKYTISESMKINDASRDFKKWSTKKIKQAQRELKKLWANPIIH